MDYLAVTSDLRRSQWEIGRYFDREMDGTSVVGGQDETRSRDVRLVRNELDVWVGLRLDFMEVS